MSKSYCFTLNNYTETDVEYFATYQDCHHLYIGKEVGESGTPHLQGYVCWGNSKRITGVKKIHECWKRVHLIDSLPGRAKANRKYCLKGEQPHSEYEELKDKGPNYGKNVQVVADHCDLNQGQRTDLDEFRDAILSGAIALELYMEYPGLMAKYRNFYKDLRQLYLKRRDYPGGGKRNRRREVDLQIHWGVAGAGKSEVAAVAGAFGLDLASKGWFDGYDDEEVVVIEEFDWQKFDIDVVKQLFDVNPYRLNIKGSGAQSNFKTIYLTSNSDPSGWWPGASEEDREAFMGRVSEVHYYPNKSAHNKRKATKYIVH